MTAPRHYERKVRITLAILVLLLLAGPALALRNCVSSIEARNEVVAAAHATDDERLVKLRNGATMLLDRGSLGPKVSDWLKLQTDETTAFEVADRNFAGGTARPTTAGAREIAQVALILKVDPQLRANVVVARDAGESDSAAAALDRSRADRINGDLIRHGVPARQIGPIVQRGASVDAKHVIDHPGQESRLFILLSR